jgi:hypothetical protein
MSEVENQPGPDAKEARNLRIMIVVGILILAVPSIALLTMADAAFREECKNKCAPSGQTYRVVNVGAPAARQGEYPATCDCILPEKRTIWERLRDLIF